ncbi:hypothetical protein QN397_05080 [Variovorax sp. RTB1]|uniref:hypothetical protein n=1 Tax=Variovorax sp. RTB1 TaxID=3048631 RepID=UPI002B23A6B3|nr:hypothetical protein [Variovorax sp. RTB1]MEB0110727.1 hypothetical protein [Variovorax sp. RTB1]
MQRASLADCFQDLLADPLSAARRLYLLNPKRADVYSVDLFTKTTTHKVTLTIPDGAATFRRVDGHP